MVYETEGTLLISKYTDFKPLDLEILRFILKHGIVTSKQIQTHIDEPGIHNVYRRLRKLEKAGMIWKKKLALTLNVYFPKRDARDFLDFPVTVANDTTLYTAQHDLIINDLILYLKTQFKSDATFDYKTEREYRYELLENRGKAEMLKKWNEIRETLPDFVILLQTHQIAVEVELNTKAAARLMKKIDLYARQIKEGKFTDVWYFVPDKSVGNALEKAKTQVSLEWSNTARSAETESGANVFQQIKVRSLPEEVKGG